MRLVTFVPGGGDANPTKKYDHLRYLRLHRLGAGRIPCATIFCISALRVFLMLSRAAGAGARLMDFLSGYGLKSCGTRPVLKFSIIQFITRAASASSSIDSENPALRSGIQPAGTFRKSAAFRSARGAGNSLAHRAMTSPAVQGVEILGRFPSRRPR